jgi:hypothetical protein
MNYLKEEVRKQLLDYFEDLIAEVSVEDEYARINILVELRELIDDQIDELKWDTSFQRTQSQLINYARKARREVEGGRARIFEL